MRTATVVFLLTVATLTIPQPELKKRLRMKRHSDVSAAALQRLVQHQMLLIQTLQMDLTATRSLASSLANSLQSLRHNFRTLQSAMLLLQENVAAISRSVAFSARISRHRDLGPRQGVPLERYQTVVFDQAFTNIGNAYNPNNGMFTAPVSGVYVFFLSLMAPNHYWLILAIVKNGVQLDQVFSGSSGEYQQGSSQLTTHLDSGDQVWVGQVAGYAMRGSLWTIYTGYLLQEE